MNKFDYKNLTPFKWFVLENFPFIEDDFDALTEWQLFCKLGKEINKIINSENTLGTQMENVTNAFIELQNYVNNYFENLDVQDEINNKLNEMAESGVLQEIISSYLNTKAIFCFDNVEAMKNATNLIDGSYARTLGYYSKNDGGGATYKIRTIINDDIVDEGSIISMSNNNLIAELIINSTIKPEYFGAHGDGIFDDTIYFKKALQFSINNNLNFQAFKKYVINDTLLINSENLNFYINEIINTAYVENLINIVNNFNNITINYITSTNNSNRAINLNGSHGHGCKYNTINIKSIKDFNIGILLLGQGNLGTIYNTFYVKYIKCNIGILLKNLTSTDFVNSNYFYDAEMSCNICIKTENVESGNDFDGNNFYNISLTNYTYGIYLNNACSNNFFGIRNLEMPNNSTLVYADNLSSQNKFIFDNYCPQNQLNIIGEKNIFFNELRSADAKYRSITGFYVSNNKFIVNENIALTSDSQEQYAGFNNDYHFNNAIIYNINMVVMIGGNLGGTYSLYINEIVKELTQIYVNIAVSNNSKVNIYDENNNIIESNLTTSGLYLLKFDGLKWVLK